MEVYRVRRERVMEKMGQGIAIVMSGSESIRNADTHYPFRPRSDFYYLTGFKEPDAVLVLDATRRRSILFCREKDPMRERWEGFHFGAVAAKETFGVDEAFDLPKLREILEVLFADSPHLFWRFGQDVSMDILIKPLFLKGLKKKSRKKSSAPRLIPIAPLIAQSRLIKDEHELNLMRKAADISAAAHVRAMKCCRVGMSEAVIEAEIVHECMRSGARFMAYPSIVAGGARACTLHYVENNQILNDGELLLIDAGAEFGFYAGDITRTFPVNGKFSEAQRRVYEWVLAAQQAAIQAVRVGARFSDVNDAALAVLVEGLIDLGILRGTVAENIETGAYRPFYMHKIGHWLGLDVHDAGAYVEASGASMPLEAGMVLTIEPGLYLSAGVPEAFLGIGVRIEDDVLVTALGAEVLTSNVPKSVADIEALMRG